MSLRRFFQPMQHLMGSLVLVPFVAFFFGSYWSLERGAPLSKVHKIESNKYIGSEIAQRKEVKLWFFDDGADWTRGIPLSYSSFLELELESGHREFTIELQADGNDSYLVLGSPNGKSYTALWNASSLKKGGLRTRTSPPLSSAQPIRFVRIKPAQGDGFFSVAGFILRKPTLKIQQWSIVPVIWIVWLLSQFAVRTTGRLSSGATRFLNLWHKVDFWLTIVVLYFIIFRLPELMIVTLALFLVVLILVKVVLTLLRRRPFITVSLAGLTIVILGYVLPYTVSTVMLSQISQLYDITVDHRLKPDGNEINSDGARFTGETHDLTENDYVILFLGDSYTYGVYLDYESSFPYVFERLANLESCQLSFRAVNFGWVSCSPLLGLRLLKEVGYKYKPDLVIYNLDMTDFHDDLRYEYQLRRTNHYEINPYETMVHLLRMYFPSLRTMFNKSSVLNNMIRSVYYTRQERKNQDFQVPEEGFYISKFPLSHTRRDIERGVMKNLRDMNRFVIERLQSSFMLIVHPRAYQYSLRESPQNWENCMYERLGPYAQEPFRYFERIKHKLPYPVLNLLPAFENASEFPLFLDDDPHWNKAGARFTAENVLRLMKEHEVLPCSHLPEDAP